MSISLWDVIRHWAVYGMGAVAGRLASFLLLPIYTRFLSPTDYGIKAMVMVGIDVVGIFVGLGILSAIVRFYWGEGDQETHPEAISTGLFLTTGLFAFGVGTALWFASPLAGLVFGDREYAPFLRLGLISLFFNSVLSVPLSYLQIKKRSGTFSLVSLSILLTAVLLNLLFVVLLGWGVKGILYSDIITYGIFCLPLVGIVLREVGWSFSPGIARRMLRYGAPLTLMPLGWLVINRADNLFLTHHGSLSEVGIYALAGQLALILLATVIQPFETVWGPGLFEVDRHPNVSELFSQIFQFFLSVLLIFSFALVLFVEDLIKVIAAPPFWPAASLVPLLVASYVLIGASAFFKSGLLVENRTGYLGSIALVTATVNVACNAFLVPRYLAIGAALSKIGAALSMAALTYMVSQRFHPQDFKLPATIKPAGYTVGLFIVSRYLPHEPVIASLLLRAGMVLALVALFARSDLWPKIVREKIRSLDWRLLIKLSQRHG